jgi:hypothetical protein
LQRFFGSFRLTHRFHDAVDQTLNNDQSISAKGSTGNQMLAEALVT